MLYFESEDVDDMIRLLHIDRERDSALPMAITIQAPQHITKSHQMTASLRLAKASTNAHLSRFSEPFSTVTIKSILQSLSQHPNLRRDTRRFIMR